MNITWHGQTCFKIITQKNKEASVEILIDPFEKETGLRPPKLGADILISTQNKKIISGRDSFLITGPGEYDIKGVYIRGIPIADKNKKEERATIFTIEVEEMKICHLGISAPKELTSRELEEVGNIDVLMIPTGGLDSLDAKEATKIMSQIEPKITIPMYYKVPGLKMKLDGLDKFLKPLGIKKLEPLTKLSVKKKDLVEKEAKIIVLTP